MVDLSGQSSIFTPSDLLERIVILERNYERVLERLNAIPLQDPRVSALGQLQMDQVKDARKLARRVARLLRDFSDA